MSDARVTITLGRSGQVVKRPRDASVGTSVDSDLVAGRKRGRGDAFTRTVRSDRANGASVGRNDLRLKLMRKRMFKRIQHEVDERRMSNQHEKVSRSISAPRSPKQSFWRNDPLQKPTPELMSVDPLRKSYYSRTSPDRVMKASRGMSPPRRTEEVQRVTLSRPVVSSRTGQVLISDVSETARLKRIAPVSSNLAGVKPVVEFPTGGARISSRSYAVQGDEPLTVGSLLQSLGLGKYAVQFRAEEVDMAVLKQMGDNDLKEMGLPMGPRKKILLALKSFSKRQPSQVKD